MPQWTSYHNGWLVQAFTCCLPSWTRLSQYAYNLNGETHIKDEQNLNYFLMNIETRAIVTQDKLPLSQGATLKWVGFSDAGVCSWW